MEEIRLYSEEKNLEVKNVQEIIRNNNEIAIEEILNADKKHKGINYVVGIRATFSF